MKSTQRTMANLTMQRRHFELIADVIQGLEVSPSVRRNIADNFATALRRTNSNFEWKRFIEACQTEEERLVEQDSELEKAGT